MEFKREPIRVTEEYRRRVAEVLSVSRVTASGWFDKTGTFDVVRIGEKTDLNNTTPMWALNLLRFTESEDGVRGTKDGFLVVYHGRMTRKRADAIVPAHVMDPGNIRFVDQHSSYRTMVPELGWVYNKQASWRYLYTTDQLSDEQLEEIIVDAEVGKKPPLFVDQAEFVRVEPGLVGRRVEVIRFSGINDLVVDTERKQLVGQYIKNLLSRKRWEPESAATKS